jgi:hypothetical protein
MRVVGEIEWARMMIDRHQTAIRRLQQSAAALEEGAATAAETLTTVSTTLNQRLSQIGQQQLRNQQDADDAKRQHLDQINLLRQKVTALREAIPETLPPPPQSPDASPRQRRPRISLLPVLPPLEAPSEPDVPPALDPAPAKAPEKTPAIVARAPAPRPRRMCFTFANFQLNIRGRPAEVLISEIRTNSAASPFATIDLISREGSFRTGIPQPPPPQLRHTIKIQNVMPALRPAPTEHPPDRPAPPPPETHPEPPRSGREMVINRMPERHPRPEFDVDRTTADVIEEKVAVIARKTVTLLADSAKQDLMMQALEIQKMVNEMITKVEGKIDREFVERMFNKFRVILSDLNEKIENIQCSFLEWVTRDELELVLNRFIGVVKEVNDAAGTKVKYNCLLCGRPRGHLAGMSFTDILPQQPDDCGEPHARPQKRYVALEFGKPEKTAIGKARDVVQFLTST